jgi:tRNA G37 N-methylase Trm5
MTKVQLTLTDQEAALLAGYGSQLGYNIPKTAKFFISKATAEILSQGIIPVYEMSEETEIKGLKALEEYKAGKTTEVTDVEKFFEEL